MKRNTYERTVLYEEVWTEPMGTVAARYGISDVMLKKICKQLEVPTPPRGYWAKLKAGLEPEIPKLPETSGPTTASGKGTDFQDKPEKSIKSTLDSLSDDERESLASASNQLSYKERVRLRTSLAQLKSACDFPERVRRVNQPQNYSFGESVSRKGARRALATAECLARAVEQMGGSMREPLTFELFGECIQLQISEQTKKVPHTLTDKELRALEAYEQRRIKYAWDSKPQVRKWDYEFIGMLGFFVDTGYGIECRESVAAASRHLVQKENTSLDALLVSVLHLICKACAAMRNQRARELEKERLRELRLQELREKTEQYNAEVMRLESTLAEAHRYKEALLLRDYAAALSTQDGDSQAKVSWMRAKADWLDPLVASSDPILGELSPEKYPLSTRPLPEVRKPPQRRYGFPGKSTWANR